MYPMVVLDGGLPFSRMNSILLTWDVEEYDAPADFGAPPLPDHGLSRGREIWQEWLGLTKELKFPGTTFCTTRLAQSAPELLRETAARGHEIASHGWSHRLGDDLQLLSSRTLYRRFPVKGWMAFVLHGFEKSTKRRLPRPDFVMMHL